MEIAALSFQNKNLIIRGPNNPLSFCNEFFVELFTWPKTNKFDLNIHPRFKP
jgi:hypothetical protein